MDFQRLLYPKTLAVIGVSKHNDMHPANVIYSSFAPLNPEMGA